MKSIETQKLWYVYIICDEDNRCCYKGLTNNITRRLDQHFQGKVKTTKSKQFYLLHVEICKSRIEARNIEKFFKSGYGREVINYLKIELADLPAGRQARRI